VFQDPTANYQVQTDDMKSLFFLDADSGGATLGKWTLTRDQSRFENCTLHNYNVVPTDKGDWLVKGSYQSGISVLDFSDLSDVRQRVLADMAFNLGPTRLGVCAAERCINVYVDTSPNQSRRYCSERCSSRANVAAYRARQKAGA